MKFYKYIKELSFIDKLGEENGGLKFGLGMFENYYLYFIYGYLLINRLFEVKDIRFIVLLIFKWEILWDRFKIERIIGNGEFGFVKKGCVLNVSKYGGWIVVVVKILKGK